MSEPTITQVASQQVSAITIRTLTSATQLKDGPIMTMSVQKRRQLSQGRYVDIVALNTVNNEEQVAGRMTMDSARNSFQTVHARLSALEAEGVNTVYVNKIIVPAVPAQALTRIVKFVNFCVNNCRGPISTISAIASDQVPLYNNLLIGEASIAIGFKHGYDDAKDKIGRTFYKGGTHRYRLPIDDVQVIAKDSTATAFRDAVKLQLIISDASAYLDGNLNAVREVNAYMTANPSFGQAVTTEEARIQRERAATATATATENTS